MSSNRADVRDFLVTRRGRITPQEAGLSFYGGNRRVPGLRREEVNPLGRALYSPVFATPGRPANLARFQFFDPAAREFYPSFEDSARTTVELLRTEAGRDPFNPSLTGLIGDLSRAARVARYDRVP